MSLSLIRGTRALKAVTLSQSAADSRKFSLLCAKKVNVDENRSLSFKYNIRAIPALLFFKNGQLRDQVLGVTSKKDLLSRLKALR